jgi:ADP-heptose:LPS heptosyltransferase
VLRALGLGDLLAGVPALRALARALPAHRKILLTPEALAPLAHATGAVDQVVDVHGVDAVPGALPPSVARPEIAVNLHGRGPQSHRALRRLQPRQLIGFANPGVFADGPAWPPGEWEPARWVRMLGTFGIDGDPRDLRIDPAALGHGHQPAWPGLEGATVVHPGAASAARRWPLARWAHVVGHERRAGREVVVTGGAAERELTGELCRLGGLPATRNLAGRTGIVELARIVAGAGRTVSGDTGVAHLATALGTPSVVLFGPVAPSLWGPPPEWAQHRPIWKGHRGDPHGTAPDPGLLAITVDDVLVELQALDDVVATGTR